MRLKKKRYLALILVGLAASIPVTFALAGGPDTLEPGDVVVPASVENPDGYAQDRVAIGDLQSKMQEIAERPRPEGQTQEEREAETNRLIHEATVEASAAAGGGELDPYPPGVVAYVPPNPLSETDMASEDKFCAELARKDPSEYMCELRKLVQAGEVPSGYFTQAEIDSVLQRGK